MALSISTQVLELPLKKPFRTSHGTFPVRKSLIIKIKSEELTGYGELSEITYYDWNISTYKEMLRNNKEELEDLTIEDPRNIHSHIQSLFPDASPLISAIDCALWDLYTKSKDQPLWKFLNLNPSEAPPSSFTISLDHPNEMLKDMLASKWPILKLKLGDKDDINFIKLLLKENITKKIRIDANEGWSLPLLSEVIKIADDLPLEFIEQPLPVNAIKGMKEIQKECSIPLIADESCQSIQDVEKCAEYFDGINIKLMKCGGISPALDMIEHSRNYQLSIMGGCMTETAIGISALCQLAPLFDYLDADGAELLAEEPARGVKVRRGSIHYPAAPGIGAKLVKQH